MNSIVPKAMCIAAAGALPLCLIAVLPAMALPLMGQSSKTEVLPGSDRVCNAALQDGTRYEVWERVLLKEWDGQPLHVKVRAYWRPGPGELLWRSTGYSKTGYASSVKENPKVAGAACGESYRHFLMLRDGEWADFWAERGRIVVRHSNLKFASREAAWAFIEEHWRDGNDDPGSSTKWAREVLVYDALGREFFRPKSLEFDARPDTYESLVSVKKAGSDWVLEMNGADEPNRATVVLDKEFKLVKAAKNP